MPKSGFIDSLKNIGIGQFGGPSATGTNAPKAGGSNGPSIDKQSSDEIFGLPPDVLFEYGDAEITSREKAKVLRSALVIELTPGWPKMGNFTGGEAMNIYDFDAQEGANQYSKILQGISVGIDKNRKPPIKIAVLNEGGLSESWGVQYGESFLEGMMNSMGGGPMSDLRYMSGTQSSGAGNKLSNNIMGQVGEKVKGMFGVGDKDFGIKSTLDSIQQKAKGVGGDTIGQHANALANLSTGSKTDFPQVWKGSSYAPSYSFVVKLYNPMPSDEQSYIKYILTPLAYLVAFMTPISDSNYTMGYPVLCRMQCPGLCEIRSGYMSNLSIIKGGDALDISFSQRPGMVELRFSISELYNTMIAKVGSDSVTEDRPTIDSYLKILDGAAKYPNTPLSGGLDFQSTIQSGITGLKNIIDTQLTTANIANNQPLSNTTPQYRKGFNDKLDNTRTSPAVNQATDTLAMTPDFSNSNYIKYQSELNSLQSLNGPISPVENLALMDKYGLTNDQVSLDYLYENYDTLNVDGKLDNIYNSDEYTTPALTSNSFTSW